MGAQLSHLSVLRSKLQLPSVRFVIVFVSLFLYVFIYQRINLRDGQQLDSAEKLAYKYNLVEKYEQEKLPDNVDPPFKRILYWNDVRYCRILSIICYIII
jgi:hypothetical protein